jgi:hypothetical protein
MRFVRSATRSASPRNKVSRMGCELLRVAALGAAVMYGYAVAAEQPCRDLSDHDLKSLAQLKFKTSADRKSIERALSSTNGPLTTGEIRIVQQPIFDTDLHAEDTPLFRLANRLHFNTREKVLRDLMVIKPGEPLTVAQLSESERLLRAKPYLYDARVLPRRVCGETVDVDVVTRDVWTIFPRLSFDRAGGDNSYSIGVSDPSIFGTGKNVSTGYSEDRDRSGVDFRYEDPNVWGSRAAFEVFLEDNDDGSRQLLDVRRPFFSLDARYALGLRLDNIDREEGLFLLGNEVSEFRHESVFGEASGGWSRGLQDGRVGRWNVGYTYDDHTFEPLPGVVAPDPFPSDRRYAYPWFGYQSIKERFEITRNFNRFHRTEDLNLGRRWGARLGWSQEAFGADDESRLVVGGGYTNVGRIREAHLFRYGFDLNGFWNFDRDEEEDVVANAVGRYNYTRSNKRAFSASLGLTYVRNLPVDKQLLLGGDSGLRGYPSRYQQGDKRVLLTLEERFFTDIYLFRLVRIGYAIFADVGRAWDSDTPSEDEFGVLSDVGVGLRLESTRTRRDRILHLDLAFPLVDGPDVSTVELTLRIKRQL